MDRNHEVTERQLLLDEHGELREPGWSRSLVQQYDRTMIKAPKFRIKEWDYYLVLSDGFAGAFTISDDGYIGLQSVSLLVFGESPWEHTETVLNAFPMGKLRMPSDTSAGLTSYIDKRLKMTFEVEHGDVAGDAAGDTADEAAGDAADEAAPATGETGPAGGRKRHIRCHFERFHEDKPFDCDIVLEQPDMDSIVIATPWDKKHAFYYNQKINCMRASGWMEYDSRRYEFDPASDFGTLDWGRGVWTYDNTWYWGSGNQDIDGHAFGFNIGYGFGNTKAATENILFYDGTAHKLDDVTFHIPESGYMDPWTFTSSDGRFEMTFTPVLDRAADLNYKVIISDQHQVFGRMNGTAVLDDGTRIEVKDMMCFAEKVHNRY